MLKHPNQAGLCGSRQHYKIIRQEEDDESIEAKDFEVSLRFSEKMELLPSLLKYMIPIALVYIAEYVINQGLVSCPLYKGLPLLSCVKSTFVIISPLYGKFLPMWADMKLLFEHAKGLEC